MVLFYRDVLGFDIKEAEDTNKVHLLKEGDLIEIGSFNTPFRG